MNCDSAFCIGKTHKVCQDYAISHMDNEGNSIVVLSDGCSSSPHTDIGARILAISTLKLRIEDSIRDGIWLNKAPDRFIKAAKIAISSIYHLSGLLPSESMDATLLTLDVWGERMFFNAWGDGILAIGFVDGSIIAYMISYPSGYPHYINYEIGPKNRKEGFNIINEGTKLSILSTNERCPGSNNQEIETPFNIMYNISDLNKQYGKAKFLAILSDGISSFYEHIKEETYTKNVPITELDVLKELLNFKSFKGQFVSRRLRKFMKDCVDKNWEHADDVSLAVVALD